MLVDDPLSGRLVEIEDPDIILVYYDVDVNAMALSIWYQLAGRI